MKEGFADKEFVKGKYKLLTLTESGVTESFVSEKPVIGGYESEKKYGDSEYCPSATRWHKKAMQEQGHSKNLVFFKTVEDAVLCGYTPCGNCWIKGDLAMDRWIDYLSACFKHEIAPIEPPKVILAQLNSSS